MFLEQDKLREGSLSSDLPLPKTLYLLSKSFSCIIVSKTFLLVRFRDNVLEKNVLFRLVTSQLVFTEASSYFDSHNTEQQPL